MALGNQKDGKKGEANKEAKKPLIKTEGTKASSSAKADPLPAKSPSKPPASIEQADETKPDPKRRWSRLTTKSTKELLQPGGQSPPVKAKANGSANKPADLKRTDSLTVPGSAVLKLGKAAEGEEESPRGDSPTSRRSSGRSIGSQLSSVDFSKLQQAAPQPEKEEKSKNAPRTTDSYIISVIPTLPQWAAILCLMMNVVIPGSGTIASGFSIFCCGSPRVQTKGDQKMETVCINVMVGIMQLFTVSLMLVGWFWAFVWGIYMIILAVEQQNEEKEKRAKELQAKALTALNSNLRPWSLVRT